MRFRTQGVLLLLCGAALLRVSLFSELYLRYVKEGLRPYLVMSGVLLLVLGVLGLVRRENGDGDHGHEDHQGLGHDHSRSPRIAWLLAAPALALLIYPPPALGSYSAEREEAKVAAQGVGTFPKLPAGDPVELTLNAFASRAQWDSGASMKGRTLRLTGFVTKDDDGRWYVARLFVNCCAADAAPLKVQVRGSKAPARDTWVTVTGTWHRTGKPGSDEARPVLNATSVQRVDQPSNPYEKR
ncbi:TIGR03943 family putative permease subunit [Streptomyces ureilyticus]|uniref:TIGR03943 family protein n=1 Tax=Streptomyces ureilyticus TaxID=1775131 RepID=A0ABX0E668_9ACTN|nr:TIGR03943 family protein [Streptomyces ureilyticus]NGO46801.1 TIGR03943 family protein [Streptomyces ureilyticus]